jgi:predicted molibdopterin-dependent oxidoreductase YjgC
VTPEGPFYHLPPKPATLPAPPPPPAPETISLTIDGRDVSVPVGSTILEACGALGIHVPTLCFLETLTAVNACRVCAVEVAGARVLLPACSRRAAPGMVVKTRSPRVDLSRKVVLELLASSVDLSVAPGLDELMREYGARPERFSEALLMPSQALRPSSPQALKPSGPQTLKPSSPQAQAVSGRFKDDNELYVRDYGKCVLCYKCVQACGTDAQHTFAIAVAGRGFEAHISTEFDVALPESACVYCGNCIQVCPTGALMPKAEFKLRQAGAWHPERQTETDTICPYCGVGCTLTVHIQDDRIIKVMSPLNNPITRGNLCVKGRFGFEYANDREL